MSVAAIPIYNALVEQGMPPERAQEAAEATAEAQRKALEEVRRKAEEFADQKVAESEKTLRGEMAVAAERAAAQAERAAAQTEQVRRDAVTRDEFHQRTGELATRGELYAVRDEIKSETRAEFAKTNAQIAELRAEHHADIAAVRAEHHADMRALNRTMTLGFIGVIGITATIVIGAIAVAVQVILAAIPNP